MNTHCSHSCKNTLPCRWHVVPATSTIAPGKELTISYRSQQPLSNLDLMLAWGFVGPPTPLDPVLPLAFRALPAIDLQLVATAAARVLLAAANSTNHKGEQRQQQQQQLRSQLLAAAAGLPLSGGLASGLKQQERLGVQLQADIMYTEAARLFTAYTELSLCPWLLSQHPANSQHNATEGVPASAYDLYVSKQDDSAQICCCACRIVDKRCCNMHHICFNTYLMFLVGPVDKAGFAH